MVEDNPPSFVVSFCSFCLMFAVLDILASMSSQTSRIPCYTQLGLYKGLYLVFKPLGLGLDNVLFDWNSVSIF